MPVSKVPAQHTAKKGRSPSYPAVALDVAVDRARVLYEREKQHPMPLSAVMDHWGYAQKSGLGVVTIAALKKFGLIEYQGTGNDKGVRVTDLALDVLLNPNPLPALQQAALTPKIHQELWAAYGSDLPSDATLRYELIRKRGFTEVGADEFIPEWKRTIAYAQLGPDTLAVSQVDTGSGVEGEGVESMPERVSAQAEGPVKAITGSTAGGQRSLHVPLLRGTSATLILPPTVTQADWAQLLRVLEAMKPGLVSDEGPQSDE